MKTIFFSILLLICCFSFSQTPKDEELIIKICLNYLEGFYEGDTLKLKKALNTNLQKFGFIRNDKKEYIPYKKMSYSRAIEYANNVRANKNFASKDAIKKVEILSILNNIAAAKVTAWWGTDLFLLAKHNDGWKIDMVLWESN